jgi:hypothetical protein
MKTLRITIVALLLLGICHVSCRREDGDTIVSPNFTNQGLLSFKARTPGGTPVQDIVIKIYLSAEDRTNGSYLDMDVTNSNGVADFGSLNSGNYYFTASQSGVGTYYEEGVVQVQAGYDVRKDLTVQ